MAFSLVWDRNAEAVYLELRDKATASFEKRRGSGKAMSSKNEGLFTHVKKCIRLLGTNPRHPGLHTHEYSSIANPYDAKQKVFEAYAQQHTPVAYRVFWCYRPEREQITVLAITKHP
ncbi:MAG: hypothetical protein AB1646_08620 [Thermodesulfobacteriota bacterium]